jgi:hypothetical protein
VYEVERLIDVRGLPEERFFRVRWVGYTARGDTWVNWRQLDCQDLIDAFWAKSKLDRGKPVWKEAEEGLRCKQCCKLYTAPQLKSHHTKRVCKWLKMSRLGGKAEKCIKQDKKAAAHRAAGAVCMDEGALKAAFTFKYLGIWFSADGDRELGREARMEQAADRFRQLGNIWYSAELDLGVKLRLYEAGVYSVLAYGSECWDLSEKAGVALRAWNARKLSMMSGREFREEYNEPSFDLLGCVRARRLKWAGQLLRAKESYLPRQVAMAELERTGGQGQPGGLFQDAPKGVTVEEMVELAGYVQEWGKLVGRVRRGET